MHRHTHFCVEVRTFTYHPNAYLSPAFYLCFSCFLLSHVLFLFFLDLPSIRNALSFLTSSAGFQSRSANFYSPHKSSISVRLFSVSPAFLFDSALYCLISCRGQFFQMFQLFTFFFFTIISRRQSPLATAWPCFGSRRVTWQTRGTLKRPEDTVYPQRDRE